MLLHNFTRGRGVRGIGWRWGFDGRNSGGRDSGGREKVDEKAGTPTKGAVKTVVMDWPREAMESGKEQGDTRSACDDEVTSTSPLYYACLVSNAL